MQFLSPYRLPELGVPAGLIAAAVQTPMGFRTVSLPECEPLIAADYPLYLTTGVFPRIGTVETEVEQRKRDSASMSEIWALTLDVDINNYVGVNKAQILNWDPHDLRDAADDMAATIGAALSSLGAEPYLTVYSGYGVYFYLAISKEVRSIERRADWQRTLRSWADALEAGWPKLIERNTLDPGTRLSRVVGSKNRKGESSIEVDVLAARNSLPLLTAEQIVSAEARVQVAVKLPRERDVIEDRRQPLVSWVRERWVEGRRHALALAVSAMLAKEGVAYEEAGLIVHQLGADDPELEDRMRAVKTTYERLASGFPVSGYYGAADVLTIQERDELAGKIRSLVRRVGHVEFVDARADVEEQPAEFSEIPQEVLFGWMQQYVELMNPTTEAPRAFHLGVGLTVAGAFLGRSVRVRYGSDELFPNLYTMLVGASGRTRKDSAIRRGTSLLRSADSGLGHFSRSPVSILRDIGSAEGLLTHLATYPSTLLHLSELSRLMANAKREVTRSISPTLMEAWDCPPVMTNQTKNPVVAKDPTLSALAAVQPDVLADLMTDADIHSGFANRWFYVAGQGGEAKPWPEQMPRDKARYLYERLVAAREIAAKRERALELDPEAHDLWESWYLEQFAIGGTTEELAMQQRLPVIAVKIALILTALEGAAAISAEALNAGIRTASWSWGNLQPLIGEWGGSIENRIHTRVTNLLTRHGRLPKAQLFQMTSSRRWSVKEFNDVLNAMERAHILGYENGVHFLA